MNATERLDAIEARALAPWSVQGVGQSLSDAVDLVAALRAVLNLADHATETHAELPEPHGPWTNGYDTAIRDVLAAIERRLT